MCASMMLASFMVQQTPTICLLPCKDPSVTLNCDDVHVIWDYKELGIILDCDDLSVDMHCEARLVTFDSVVICETTYSRALSLLPLFSTSLSMMTSISASCRPTMCV